MLYVTLKYECAMLNTNIQMYLLSLCIWTFNMYFCVCGKNGWMSHASTPICSAGWGQRVCVCVCVCVCGVYVCVPVNRSGPRMSSVSPAPQPCGSHQPITEWFMSVPPFSVTAGLATLHYNKLGWKSLSLTLCVCARVGRACDLINVNKAAYGINRPVLYIWRSKESAAHPQIHLLTGRRSGKWWLTHWLCSVGISSRRFHYC